MANVMDGHEAFVRAQVVAQLADSALVKASEYANTRNLQDFGFSGIKVYSGLNYLGTFDVFYRDTSYRGISESRRLVIQCTDQPGDVHYDQATSLTAWDAGGRRKVAVVSHQDPYRPQETTIYPTITRAGANEYYDWEIETKTRKYGTVSSESALSAFLRDKNSFVGTSEEWLWRSFPANLDTKGHIALIALQILEQAQKGDLSKVTIPGERATQKTLTTLRR